MNWTELRRSYPLSTQCFNNWVLAKSPIRGYDTFLKGGTKVIDLPFEMLHGVLAVFFSEQGVLFSTNTSVRGQLRIRLHRQRVSGQFYPFGEGEQKITIQHHLAWQEAFVRAFAEVERVCTNSSASPVEIDGRDITAFGE